ncbi:MAG: P-loop containing nucleoside triphosphate hydrolase protein [Linnemannia elongata]|nr:MAG: P-loop containing nucleoside triphosphate hydrolase protein [Linnemannia elongata]
MLKKDELKNGNRSAEASLQPSTTASTNVDSLGDKLNAINLTSVASSSLPSKGATASATTASVVAPIDDFDVNDMDDPLAGFEAQRSGIKDISLKEQFLNPTDANIESLQTLLAARIREGSGETLFEIGVEEDGAPMKLSDAEYETALTTVKTAAAAVGAEVAIMFEKSAGLSTGAPIVPESKDKEDKDAAIASEPSIAPTAEVTDQPTYKSSYVMIRKTPKSVDELLELRVAVVGNVDAGKSTLLGVLTKGVLDDGRGKARVNLFRHKHEIDSGRTSSVGMEILGFDAKSVPVPTMSHGRNAPWDEICGKAAKVLSFIDLAGHERYLKTTVFGMTGCAPDFVMLMIGSNAGIVGMTKEHLGLSLALGVPVLVVITKIDMCPPNVLENTVKQLTKILKSAGCRKIPMFVKSHEDVVVTAGNFVSDRICPIFQVSNVTGEGLDLLKNFLNVLPISQKYNRDDPVEYQITDTFSVPFVGTVVSGVVMNGIVHAGDQLYLGPDGNGAFQMVTVKSIQRKRLNVPLACAGQSASFGLKKIRRSTIRKGMVMLDKETTPPPRGCREFEAEILVLYHSTTIGHKYQAMLHCGAVRQTARVLAMDKPDQILRTGDRATVRFQFLQPAYLKVGARLIFREGRTKGIGKVSKIVA